MKLTYPQDNLYNYCKNDAENCQSNLSDAVAESSFGHIPSDFTYLEFLQNLHNFLDKNHQEIINIDKKIRNTDQEYNSLSENLANEASKIVINKIKKRDRLVK